MPVLPGLRIALIVHAVAIHILLVGFVLPQAVHHESVVASGCQAHSADVVEHMSGPGEVLGVHIHQVSTPVRHEHRSVGPPGVPVVFAGRRHAGGQAVVGTLQRHPGQDPDARIDLAHLGQRQLLAARRGRG